METEIITILKYPVCPYNLALIVYWFYKDIYRTISISPLLWVRRDILTGKWYPDDFGTSLRLLLTTDLLFHLINIKKQIKASLLNEGINKPLKMKILLMKIKVDEYINHLHNTVFKNEVMEEASHIFFNYDDSFLINMEALLKSKVLISETPELELS